MKPTSLEDTLPIVQSMDDVMDAHIWTPDEDAVADGQSERQLEVCIWKSCGNPTSVKIAIEELGLECVADGSCSDGPTYSFTLRDIRQTG